MNIFSSDNEGGGIGELWRVTYPLILSTASMTVMQFVNRLFLAWYSPDAIAASVPSGMLNFVFICFFVGMTSYTNVFVAQYFGARKPVRMTVSLWQGILLSLVSWVAILALAPVGGMLILSSGHAPQVKAMELQYFMTVVYFGGLPVLNAALSSFFTGQGDTKITMFVTMAGNIVNVMLSYACVFGFWFIPEMGIKGAAIAMVTGHATMTFIYSCLIFSPASRKKFHTWELKGFNRRLFWKMVRFSIPNGVGMLLDVASFTVFVFLAGNMDDKAVLAANNIILSIDMLAFMPVLGVGTATMTLVGQYIGKGKPEVTYTIVTNALKLAVGYTVVIGAMFYFVPEVFVRMFGAGDSGDYGLIFNHTYTLMKILPFFILFDSCGIIFSDAIRGAGDTRFQMLTSVLCAWLFFVPGVYICLNLLHLPMEIAWTWGAFYLFVLSLVYYLRLRSGRWKEIRVME